MCRECNFKKNGNYMHIIFGLFNVITAMVIGSVLAFSVALFGFLKMDVGAINNRPVEVGYAAVVSYNKKIFAI